MDNSDLKGLRVIFTPNLPKAILEELKSLVDAGAELSQETILGLASFVPDVQAELKRVNKETQRCDTKRNRRAVGQFLQWSENHT